MKIIISFALILFANLVVADTTSYVCNYPKYSDEKGSHSVEK